VSRAATLLIFGSNIVLSLQNSGYSRAIAKVPTIFMFAKFRDKKRAEGEQSHGGELMGGEQLRGSGPGQ